MTHNALHPTQLVSIILVNWNGKRWLENCLQTLAEQNYPNLEILLVDNASTDDSLTYVREHFPKVRLVLMEKNLGFACAVNAGVEEARGEHILLLNTDTQSPPDLVSNLLSEKQARRLDVIAARETDYDIKKKPKSYTTRIDLLGHPVKQRNQRGNNFYLVGCALLFDRQLFLETGGFDENFFMYCEEVDWFWRLLLFDKSFDYAQSACVGHFGEGSTGRDGMARRFLWRNQNTLQMLLKNYHWLALIAAIPLYLLQNLLEFIVLTMVGKWHLARTYPVALIDNLHWLPATIHKRHATQTLRKKSDIAIVARMYWSSGKLQHLLSFSTHDKDRITP